MITYIVIAVTYIFIGFIAYYLAFRHQIELDMLNYGRNKTDTANGLDGDDYAWFMLCGIAWPLMLIAFILIWIHCHIMVSVVLKSIKDKNADAEYEKE